MRDIYPVTCKECGLPVGYSFSQPGPYEILCELCMTEFAIVHHTLMIHAEKFTADMENDLQKIKNNYNSAKRREEYNRVLTWQKDALDHRTNLQIAALMLDNSKQRE